jgi:hypothetical protein
VRKFKKLIFLKIEPGYGIEMKNTTKHVREKKVYFPARQSFLFIPGSKE